MSELFERMRLMAIITKAIRGTQDVLPSESKKLQYVENAMLENAALFGYREMRTPVFEHTELFQRSVGDTTDVVQKEMYTFDDKGGRSITLRPEGTAGMVRALLEHGLYNDVLPQKVCYLTSCYRYEKPQAGRLREFHQFGIECFGTASPAADAEVIALASMIFVSLGITDLSLEINSIGCPDCRKKYHEALHKYFSAHIDELCETCRGRLDKNPMRILDCKSPVCSKIADGAPIILDYICDGCKEHFEKVKSFLRAENIEFKVNPHIVRGLDYYTRTVFEFVSNEIGAQGTVCGGGRYDGLVEQMGGPNLPSLGFAMGIERLLLLMKAQNCEVPAEDSCDIYFANLGENALDEIVRLANDMREEGFSVQYDLEGRSLKSQMKYADKLGAKYTVVIGDDEIKTGCVKIKNMKNRQQHEVKLDKIVSEFYNISIKNAADNLTDSINPFDTAGMDSIDKILGGKK